IHRMWIRGSSTPLFPSVIHSASAPGASGRDVESGILGAASDVEARVHAELACDQIAKAHAARADRPRLVPRLAPAVGLAHAGERDGRPALRDVPAHLGLGD